MSSDTRQSATRHAVRQHGAVLILIAIVGGGVYLNALPNPFVWDDDWIIVANREIRDLGNVPTFFVPSYWHRFYLEHFRSFAGRGYRPVPEISFAIDHAIWGLNPVGFHLTNVVVHIVNCVLAYFLTYRIFGSRLVAVFGTLLFAAHPLHTEAVVWVKVRSQLLAVSFMLAAMLTYAKHAEELGTGRDRRLYLGSVAFYALAILCKATAIVLPGILALYTWCFVPRSRWRGLFFGYLPFAGAVMALFALDPLMPVMPRGRLGALAYAGAIIGVLGEYVRLFLAPVSLCIDRHWHHRPGEMAAELVPVAPFVLGLAAAGLVALRRSRRVLFALGWFLIALSPAFRVAFMGRPIAESRIYGPSIGLCMLFGFGLQRLAELANRRLSGRVGARLAAAVCVLVVGVCGGLTIVRNADWSDRFHLWLDTVRKNPLSSHAQIRVAQGYQHRGHYDKAIEHLEACAELRPRDTGVLRDLGGILEHLERPEEAMAQYRKLLKIDSDNVAARVRLGVLHAQEGEPARAELYLLSATKRDQFSADAHHNLGIFYTNEGEHEKAIVALERAVELAPGDLLMRQRLAAEYAEVGRDARATAEYETIAAMAPADPGAWLGLGMYHERLGHRAEARGAYKRALALGGPTVEIARERLAAVDAEAEP